MSRWFEFSGRVSRHQFWLHYVLPITVLVFAAAMLDGLVLGGRDEDGVGMLTALVSLPSFLGMLSACIRRLHDTDRHGGWVLLMTAVPVVSVVVGVLLLGCMPGTEFDNRFGPVPF